ncbi:unnamed protein product [Enterobius vermicularis]|uniref:DNA replication licensing factor MCM5 n=1 Tax=Enterobius vermicularis TaxID=51028 RepID=A0A158Q9Z0_ENTVE|nr:unnamed protein product [Enterobius vermicularis]
MTSFDNPGLFYQERFFANDDIPDENQGLIAEYRQLMQKFRKFLREFTVGGFGMIYRDQLKRNCGLGRCHLEVSLDHIMMFDEESGTKLKQNPTRYLSALEEAAKLVAIEVAQPASEEEREIESVQVTLSLGDLPTTVRKLKATQVSQLVKISGVVVAAGQVRSKCTRVSLQCRSCRHTVNSVELKPGLDGFALPRKCGADQTGQLKRCPLDPYYIMPDKCRCIDVQTLKLQENPENVPHGEMPRHIQLYCERYLVDAVVPGNQVTVVGVLSIKKLQKQKNTDKSFSGTRAPYIRVLGIQVQTSGGGRVDRLSWTPEEERQFQELAKRPDVYEVITRSIAPFIYGSEDIKKAIVCLLFGGSRKQTPDGLTRRGDINVLLLGDPGTAKSQLLKFIEKVSPIGVYTSGKGSSAAGLTASISRDPQSRSFYLEGGAMVLADGGVVGIDEFDKMKEDDRVAIHEAMEQQTISIAKAGITTTLNSRCSVVAAANSVYGRWDEGKGDENIDFMPTILSRFDMIFIVKDAFDAAKDSALAKHVLSVHSYGSVTEEHGKPAEGELSVEFLKKYIWFCRNNCGPRISEPASKKLVNHYVRLRNPVASFKYVYKLGNNAAISITVRQLEAIIRISEALAKMELLPFANEKHVDEALRLFRVSTVKAAEGGHLIGVEGFTSPVDQEMAIRVEKQLKKRLALGNHVSEYLVIQDFLQQNYPELIIRKVIQSCIRKGELQYRMQRKMLYRVR